MSTLRHEMIFASAGSGKTFALTTRFIRLLALGVAPERIVALTFTRKAAGEFFGEILNRLAAASGDEAKARALAMAVERPELAAADFRRLLRGMIGAMHRLNLGTLDGFFARIVRAFPLELGLGGEPGLLDEHAAAEEMRRVLGRLFAARGGLTPEQKDLIEAFRMATLGKEEKNVAGQFDAFVREHLELWRAAPVPAKWGTAARIWPRGFPWRVADDAATARAAEELIAWAERTELSEKHRARLTAFARAALEWSPGAPLNSEIGYVAEKALADWRSFEAGSAELKLDRKAIALGPVATAAVATLVGRLVGLELGRRMAVTQGIAAVMRTFDALYDAEVRRAGRLTFADLQQLLSPERLAREAATADTGRENTGPGASDSEGDGDTGLETRATTEQATAGGLAGAGLDYRIDARLDHWLFDEFQDTSYQQWKILERLVDEVVEDPEGRRSLFYVGDVKQAIFTWREGDPRLFSHVAERYRGAAGGGVVARELNDSWRSGPALIEMVNRVCGDEAAMAELFPEAAGEWKKYWREHRSARPENRGQAALLFADDADGRWATVLRLLREIRPTARGLTCAVLVRKNDVGVRLAEYLRREGGIAAVAESDLKIGTDNPAATALAALLQAAAHPEDGFAWRQVAMSPLAVLLAGGDCGRAGKGTLGSGGLSPESGGGAHGHGSGDPCHGTGRPPAALCRGVLGAVETDGFEAWLEEWARRLEPALAADDAFTRLRLRQLVAAGRAFDETGARDVDAFLRFLGEYTVREPEGAGVVRVLTVHKSKGLGFDVVILPDLEGRTLVQRREGPAVRKAADRSVAWVLQYPGATIAENDPVLREYQTEALAENCYEQLSLLYVALTRGKRGLYVVIERPGKTASRNYPKLLVETLGEEEREVRVGGATFAGSWSAGEPEWFAELGLAAARQGAESDAGIGAAETSLAELSAAVRGRAGLLARRPSGEKPKRVGGAVLFSSGGGVERTHGRRVHALLAAVEWADGTERERLAEFVRRQPEPEAWSAALREAEACLDAEELRAVFTRAGAEDEVWRERAFEAVVGGAWVSGVPDRVVVRRERGTPRGATIYDFKTDQDADAERLRQRYAEQLELYREVVAGLLGLAVARVECRLVATAERSLVGI